MLSCLPDSFVLCNRSSIINLLHVEAYTTDRNNKGYLQLKTGAVIPVSRRKKAEVRDKLNRQMTVQRTFRIFACINEMKFLVLAGCYIVCNII
jgi:hypothetical protein